MSLPSFIARKAIYRARLPIRKGGVFSHYSSMTYYFDADMNELGYTVNSGKFHEIRRDWSPEYLEKYHIQNIRTNEVIQEGRK